jgi:glycine/D-amino acid oxidase-like deaminating enzyme
MGTEWRVLTANGRQVKARYLVIATNGYTDELWPELKRQIIPLVTRQTATEPLSLALRDQILSRGHHVSDTRNNMAYFRIDEQGRFQIGGRGNPLSTASQYGSTRHLRADALRIYPQLQGVKWEFDWGGLVALTQNHAPQLLQLGPNAYAGLGYNGRGVAMATLMGQQLANRIAGEDVPMPCESLSPIRFHRFRNLGAAWHLFSGAVRDYIDGRNFDLGR